MAFAVPTMREMKRPVKWIIAILYTVIFIFLLFSWYAEKVNEDLSESMIRLHIVANSDSSVDQSLKLRVRDAIVSYMKDQMDRLGNKEDARSFVKDHIGELETVANRVITQEGVQDIARATFGNFPFPTKQYENMTLPAGFYEALKIEIGKADGQNWWCVMFPPLCFVEDTKGEMDAEYMEILEEQLTEDEMEIILTSGSENEIPVEIKFKIVEIFQESKIKLASLFRGIINFNE